MSTWQRKTPAEHWQTAAPALAAVTMARLVNRADVFGYFRGGHPRTMSADRQVPLSNAILTKHFSGQAAGYAVGCHAIGPGDLSRWGALDIDAHGGADEEMRAANLLMARRCAMFMHLDGMLPLIESSDGQGGYHVWAVFREPAPSAKVFWWLQNIADRCEAMGDGRPGETYPRQPSVRGLKRGYGSWMRLPGRHPKHPEYWSTFVTLAGEELSGKAAVAAWAEMPLSDPALLPDVPVPEPVVSASGHPRGSRGTLRPTYTGGASAPVDVRARRYMASVEHVPAGHGRNIRAFRLAAFLRRDLGLGEADALDYLREWNGGHAEPLPDDELRKVCENAATYARGRVAT